MKISAKTRDCVIHGCTTKLCEIFLKHPVYTSVALLFLIVLVIWILVIFFSP